VVPYGAFRSMCGEQEDRTYELLSITTLHPRQIVSGKLASSIVQMLVYLSAVSPCLAFTYLLRGIDVFTIFLVVAYLFAGSLGYTMLALLLATLTDRRHWQIIMSVVIILALFLSFFSTAMTAGSMLAFGELFVQSREFWYAHICWLTIYLSNFALVFLATASRLTFAQDNRSTALRVCLMLQQALFLGWYAFYANQDGFFRVIERMAQGILIMFALYWYFMGVFLTGEQSYVSARVRRQLPQSFLGRTFFTLFNPGSGTGFLFTLGNMCTVSLLMVGIAFTFGQVITSSSYVSFDTVVQTAILALAQDFRTVGGERIMVPQGGPNDGRNRLETKRTNQG